MLQSEGWDYVDVDMWLQIFVLHVCTCVNANTLAGRAHENFCEDLTLGMPVSPKNNGSYSTAIGSQNISAVFSENDCLSIKALFFLIFLLKARML